MNFSASVIIPTYNGANKIKNLLKSLTEQSFKDFEVIIVIDGSTDSTLEVVRCFDGAFSNLKILSQENRGRSVVRNRGAREAAASVLIFYDDDMIPAHDSIQKHCDFNNSCMGLVCGDQAEIYDPKNSDIQNYKVGLTKKWTDKYKEGLNRMDLQNLFFSASNCSVRKELFFRLGGFDERLTDAEDFDFAFRAIENNIDVYYDKSNKAVHNDFITARSYVKRQRQYVAANKKLLLIHPDRKGKVYTKANFFKRFIYWFFASSHLIRLIDTQNILMCLPKWFRYRIYNIIIQSLSYEYPNVSI